MSSFSPGNITHQQIADASQFIEITDLVVAPPGGKMGEFNQDIPNKNIYRATVNDDVKRMSDHIQYFADIANAEHDNNHFHDQVFELLKKLSTNIDVDAEKILEKLHNDGEVSSLEFLHKIANGELTGKNLNNRKEFSEAFKGKKYSEAIALIKQGGVNLIAQAGADNHDQIPKMMFHKSLNKVIRLSFNEFSFYTENKPLSVEEYHQVLKNVDEIAKGLNENLYLVLASFAVKTANNQVHNMVIHVQCGDKPTIHHFAKSVPSSIDAVYTGTINPYFLGTNEQSIVLTNKIKVGADEKTLDELTNYIEVNKDASWELENWFEQLKLKLLADLNHPPQTRLIQIIDSLYNKASNMESLSDKEIDIFKAEIEEFKHSANQLSQVADISDLPYIIQSGIKFNDTKKYSEVNFNNAGTDLTIAYKDIYDELVTHAATHTSWALAMLRAIERDINECDNSGFPADAVRLAFKSAVTTLIGNLTSAVPLDSSKLGILKKGIAWHPLEKTTEWDFPMNDIHDNVEQFANTYNFPFFGIALLKTLKEYVEYGDVNSDAVYKSPLELIPHIDQMINELTANNQLTSAAILKLKTVMDNYKNDCLAKYEIRIRPTVTAVTPDIGKIKMQSEAKTGNELATIVIDNLSRLDTNDPQVNRLAKIQLQYLKSALFFPREALLSSIEIIEQKLYLQDRLAEIELLMSKQNSLIQMASRKLPELNVAELSDISKLNSEINAIKMKLIYFFPNSKIQIDEISNKSEALLNKAEFLNLIQSVKSGVDKLLSDTDSDIISGQHILQIEELKSGLVILKDKVPDKYEIDKLISCLEDVLEKLVKNPGAHLEKSDMVLFKAKNSDLNEFLKERTQLYEINDFDRQKFNEAMVDRAVFIDGMKNVIKVIPHEIADLERELADDRKILIIGKIGNIVNAADKLSTDLVSFQEDPSNVALLINNPLIRRNLELKTQIMSCSQLANNEAANKKREALVGEIGKWLNGLDYSSQIQATELTRMLNYLATIQDISMDGVNAINKLKTKIIEGKQINYTDISKLSNELQPYLQYLNDIKYWHFPTSSPSQNIVYDSSFTCHTAGHLQFTTTVGVCLDHLKAIEIRNYYNKLHSSSEPIPGPVSQIVASNSVNLLAGHIVANDSHVLHADVVTESRGNKTSTVIDERVMGVRNIATKSIVPIEELSDKANAIKPQDNVRYNQTNCTKTAEEITVNNPPFGPKVIIRKYKPHQLVMMPFVNGNRASVDTQTASFYTSTINRLLDMFEIPSNSILIKDINEFKAKLDGHKSDPAVTASAIFKDFDIFKKKIESQPVDINNKILATLKHGLLEQIKAIETYLNTKMISIESYIASRLLTTLSEDSLTPNQKIAIGNLKSDLANIERNSIMYDSSVMPIDKPDLLFNAIYAFMSDISKDAVSGELERVSNEIESTLQTHYPSVQAKLEELYSLEPGNNAEKYFNRRKNILENEKANLQSQLSGLEKSKQFASLTAHHTWEYRDDKTLMLEMDIISKLDAYLETHRVTKQDPQHQIIMKLRDELQSMYNSKEESSGKSLLLISQLTTELIKFKNILGIQSLQSLNPVYEEIIKDLQINHPKIYVSLKETMEDRTPRTTFLQEHHLYETHHNVLKKRIENVYLQQERIEQIDRELPELQQKLHLIKGKCNDISFDVDLQKMGYDSHLYQQEYFKSQQVTMDEQYANMLEKLKNLSKENSQLDVMMSSIQQEMQRLTDEIKVLTNEKLLMQKMQEQFTDQVKEISSLLDINTRKSAEINIKAATIEKSIQQNELLINQLRDDSEAIGAKLATLKANSIRPRELKGIIDQDTLKMQDNVKRLALVTPRSSDGVLLGNTIDDLRKRIQLNQAEYVKLNVNLVDVDKQQAELIGNQQELINKVKQLTNENELSSQQLQLLKNEKIKLETNQQLLNQQLLSKNEELKELNVKINEIVHVVGGKEMEFAQKNDTLRDSNERLKANKTQMVETESDLQKLKSASEENRQHYDETVREGQHLKQKMDEVSEQLKLVTTEEGELDKQVISLKQEKEHIENDLKKEENSLPLLNNEMEKIDEKYRGLDDQMDRHREQQKEIDKQINQVKSAITNLEEREDFRMR